MSKLGRKGAFRRLATAVAVAALGAWWLGGSVAPAAASNCAPFSHRAKIESDPFGTDLAYLRVRQRVCSDGTKVTGVRQLFVHPKITGAGEKTNWQFDGIVQQTERYAQWHGVRHGKHISYVAGQFHQTIGPVTSTSVIWVKIIGKADATASILWHDG